MSTLDTVFPFISILYIDRASLCAAAVTALGLSMRTQSRLNYPPLRRRRQPARLGCNTEVQARVIELRWKLS